MEILSIMILILMLNNCHRKNINSTCISFIDYKWKKKVALVKFYNPCTVKQGLKFISS